jgi:hypothetical protein
MPLCKRGFFLGKDRDPQARLKTFFPIEKEVVD